MRSFIYRAFNFLVFLVSIAVSLGDSTRIHRNVI